MLDLVITGRGSLLVGRDGVDVFGIGRVGDVDAGAMTQLDQSFDQVMGPFRPFLLDDGFEGIKPLPGFLSIRIEGDGGHGFFLLRWAMPWVMAGGPSGATGGWAGMPEGMGKFYPQSAT